MRLAARCAPVLLSTCLIVIGLGRAAAQGQDTTRLRDAAIRGFALVQATQKQSLTKQAPAPATSR
jgi:hypothetical protein